MKTHSDNGRYLISKAILLSEWTSQDLKNKALQCILAYIPSTRFKRLIS
jgi:hypothetical protein